MPLPSVCVLLPVRNAARHLPVALRSLVRQTLEPSQVVVVDDASTDGSAQVLAGFAHRLPLTVVAGLGRGLAHALNCGLAACSGEWVARMDADDVMHPHRLAAQAAFAVAHPEVAVVGCGVRSFPRAQVSARRHGYDAWLNSLTTPAQHARDMYVEAPLAHPSAMIRRAWLEQVGGYRHVGWPEDYDLWLRLHGAGARFAKPAGIHHLWREHPQRLSRTHTDYTLEAIRACRLHHLTQHWDLCQRGVVVVGAGFEGKRAGRGLLALGVPVLAHVDADPRKVGGRLDAEGGIRVHAPGALVGLLQRKPRPLAVVAVGTQGHRPVLRRELEAMGLVEGEDMVMAA